MHGGAVYRLLAVQFTTAVLLAARVPAPWWRQAIAWALVASWFALVVSVIWHLVIIQGSVRGIGREISQLNTNIGRALERDRPGD